MAFADNIEAARLILKKYARAFYVDQQEQQKLIEQTLGVALNRLDQAFDFEIEEWLFCLMHEIVLFNLSRTGDLFETGLRESQPSPYGFGLSKFPTTESLRFFSDSLTDMKSAENRLILLAEDEALVSIWVEELLIEAGFQVFLVADTQSALAALEEDSARFCAVVTDIRMPGKGDGWELAHRARQLQPVLPIIYITGDSAERWERNGVPESVLLQKPFDGAQIVTALTALLNEGSSSRVS